MWVACTYLKLINKDKLGILDFGDGSLNTLRYKGCIFLHNKYQLWVKFVACNYLKHVNRNRSVYVLEMHGFSDGICFVFSDGICLMISWIVLSGKLHWKIHQSSNTLMYEDWILSHNKYQYHWVGDRIREKGSTIFITLVSIINVYFH